MKIFVVMGSTGEYSDRNDWIVKAFTDEKKAQDLVEKASAVAREIFTKYNWNLTYDEREKLFVNPFDKNFQMDYTGTNYGYEEVELVTEDI